jgi:DNA repair photolyase
MPLRIFMSSSTDPYVPQEKRLGLTQGLLEAMTKRPPDALVIQTHSTLVLRDLELIANLSRQTKVWVSITVETDLEQIVGFPPHAFSPSSRISALRAFRSRCVRTRATVAPLLPIRDVDRFAHELGEAANCINIDHYLLGDGSPGGLRTRRTAFPSLLSAAGYEEWNSLDMFWEVVERFREILSAERVLTSKDGFNDLER